jgi:hypothetical protein
MRHNQILSRAKKLTHASLRLKYLVVSVKLNINTSRLTGTAHLAGKSLPQRAMTLDEVITLTLEERE